MVRFRGKGKEGRFFGQREAHKPRKGMVGSQAWQGQSVLGKGTAWTEKLEPDFGGA